MVDTPKRPGNVTVIDWLNIVNTLETLYPDGERGGSDVGHQALELILGVEAIRSAVDYYIAGRPGFELARSVLAIIKPFSAMERCVEIARSEADIEHRRSAVELLRMIADRRGIAWATEFLHDDDDGVQIWAAGIVDQLLWSGLAEPDDCGELLDEMEKHPNPGVLRYASLIRTFLESRREQADTADSSREFG